MKRIFVTGMVILTTSFASAVVTKSLREVLVTNTEDVRADYYGGKGKTVENLDKAALEQAKNKLVNELGMPDLHTVMSGTSGKAHLDQLVAVVAAKKYAVALKNDPNYKEEGESIEAAAKATARLIANSNLIGALKSKTLSTDEVALVRLAIEKLQKLPADILTKFTKAERDSYTKVLEKYDELNSSGNGRSAEENLVQAIMTVNKNVDRTKALEIIEKLKKCV
ncbi:MAG: hypothetical protein ACXVCY_11540 [Pseudobdellovibrionaceae bacterium]